MGISYRLIGTYNTDTMTLTNWAGPVSGTAFTAVGTNTHWGNSFAVSNFNIGSTFGSGPADVLNTSGFGYDELNLSALLSSTSSHSVTNATVFNWSPGNPGVGCDTFSVATDTSDGHLSYSDTLASSMWGGVVDYEAAIDMSSYWDTGASVVSVSGFQVTNLQLTATMHGGASTQVTASNVQTGTFDLSGSYAASLTISTASASTQGGSQAYVVRADTISSSVNLGLQGDQVTLVNGTQATSYTGATMVDNGSTSLIDFFDNGGDNTINLSASLISSNLYLNGAMGGTSTSGGGSMSFLSSYTNTSAVQAAASAGGCDVSALGASGSGDISHIFTSDIGGVALVNNFVLGRDTLDMTVVGSGGAGYLASLSVGSGSATLVGGTSSSNGVVLTGFTVAALTPHMTTAMVGGVEHLYVH